MMDDPRSRLIADPPGAFYATCRSDAEARRVWGIMTHLERSWWWLATVIDQRDHARTLAARTEAELAEMARRYCEQGSIVRLSDDAVMMEPKR